ncbi:hypothetical protein AB1Y20_018072 [Prymnesium parvum]|uniref:HAT C-terminal dimerisation domain-containing protein n=1 Tax=Prymnesium parvum TaxID=97485 RepID=A0AB34JNT0_PRYPA
MPPAVAAAASAAMTTRLALGDTVSVAVGAFGEEYARSRGASPWRSEHVRDEGKVIGREGNKWKVEFSDAVHLFDRKALWFVCRQEAGDTGKIPEVALIITKVSKVLHRFWGKTRWARARLREVTKHNHGKEIGLYRAKVTRFAGKVMEMARILRLKSDLQQIVVSGDYALQKFTINSAADEGEADGETVLGSRDPVKVILLDEAGFWEPLVQALVVMTPILKLLRLMDGETPCMGKVYPHMKVIRRKLTQSPVTWKAKVLEIHDDRWEYLKSPMHVAASALDPEFIEEDTNDEVMDGLITVTERLALRDELYSRTEQGKSSDGTTINSAEVQARLSKTMLQLGSYQSRQGHFNKDFVINNAKVQPPAEWWNTYGQSISSLASVARCVLNQPVSASAAERNWSVYGKIKSENRTRLRHHKSDKLVYCHEALHLKLKLQKAGYTQSAAKWESDSDSDGSDDEADLMW